MSAGIKFTYGDAAGSARRDANGTVHVTDAAGMEHRFTVLPAGDGVVVRGDRGSTVARVVREGQVVWVRWRGRTYRLEVQTGRRRRSAPGPGGLGAPMPGQILQHLVEPGARVESGTPLLVLEAMKMQLEIKAPAPGRVVRFLAEVGDRVPSGAALVELETE